MSILAAYKDRVRSGFLGGSAEVDQALFQLHNQLSIDATRSGLCKLIRTQALKARAAG